MSGGYLPKRGLDALLEYKYKSGDYSWLDLRLNNFWIWCAEQLPMTMAPNLVTLIGTFHLIAIAVFAQIFDPRLEGESPSWVYLLNAWCLFVYQTMDAVDGKQARRTGSSSPLGQLFDHGCDALGSTYIVIGLCSLMGFGAGVGTLVCLATVQIPFFLCQWEENQIHILRAQVGNFGVTEGQYLSMSLNLVTAFMGVGFWKQTIYELLSNYVGIAIENEYLKTFEVRQAALLIGGFFPAILALSTIVAVIGKKDLDHFRAFLSLIPFTLQQLLMVCIDRTTPANELFQSYPVPTIVLLGLLYSHLTNRIIIASVCHIHFPVIHKIIIPVPFLMGMMVYLQGKDQDQRMVVHTFLIVYGVAVFIQYFHFVIIVTNKICNHLKIRCFTITTPENKKNE